MLREQIRKDIAKAIQATKYKIQDTDIEVTRTSDPKFGDYTTNVAFKLGPKNKQSSQELAKVLTDSLRDLPHVEKLEV